MQFSLSAALLVLATSAYAADLDVQGAPLTAPDGVSLVPQAVVAHRIAICEKITTRGQPEFRDCLVNGPKELQTQIKAAASQGPQDGTRWDKYL